MKLFTLAALAATLFSMNAHAVREHGGRLQKPTWTCEQYVAESGYRISVEAAETWVRIRQESPIARYAPIDLNVEQVGFTGEVSPEISCEQASETYSIRVLVKDGVVQILQSSPNARYAPVQLEEVK